MLWVGSAWDGCGGLGWDICAVEWYWCVEWCWGREVMYVRQLFGVVSSRADTSGALCLLVCETASKEH